MASRRNDPHLRHALASNFVTPKRTAPVLPVTATYLKGRLGKAQQVCSRAVVVAMGVNEDGRRELLGNSCGEGFAYKVGDSESEPFWAKFNRCAEGKAYAHLNERGLAGVKLVISDVHAGLTKAIGRQLQGSVWPRCRVHFARNLLQCDL